MITAKLDIAEPTITELAPVKISSLEAVRVVTLNRPRAHNALDAAMTGVLLAAVPQIARDPNAYAIVLRAARTGPFCVGGDVREMARLAITDPDIAARALAAEYELVWMLECFSKPVISLIDGAVMGAGAGITTVNTHRVAGANYAFSMPEVRIGFFPDDGISAVLARMPDCIGIYLGLTGRAIGRDDAFALGLVTHCIDATEFGKIEQCLGNADPVDPLLDDLHQPVGPGELPARRALIADCFSATSVQVILARLAEVREGAPLEVERQWAANVLSDLALASPCALKIALRHIRDASALDLRQTLMLDCRIGRRLIGAHDFQEGVRARLVDRDRAPQWRWPTCEDVSAPYIDSLFKASIGGELILPTRVEMQSARV